MTCPIFYMGWIRFECQADEHEDKDFPHWADTVIPSPNSNFEQPARFFWGEHRRTLQAQRAWDDGLDKLA